MKKKLLAVLAGLLCVVCVAGGYIAYNNAQQEKEFNKKVATELDTVPDIVVQEGNTLPSMDESFEQTTTIDKDSIVANIQNVDITTPGNYEVTYNFTDVNGQERQKTVNCTVKANLEEHVEGMEDITVDYNGKMPESNVTYDSYIDSVTRDDSSVDITTPGTYPITYTILGTDGEMISVDHLATVIDTRPDPSPTPAPKTKQKDKEKTVETGNVAKNTVTKDHTVQTGDSSNVIFVILILIIATGNLGWLIYRKRKK